MQTPGITENAPRLRLGLVSFAFRAGRRFLHGFLSGLVAGNANRRGFERVDVALRGKLRRAAVGVNDLGRVGAAAGRTAGPGVDAAAGSPRFRRRRLRHLGVNTGRNGGQARRGREFPRGGTLGRGAGLGGRRGRRRT